MTTHFNGNGCWLSVGQSVDTLKATTGFWYFRDSNAPRTGNAEYQSGLALSMNIDYEKFIDSRFAMNIYKLAAIGSTTEETAAPSVTLPKEFTQTAMRTVLKANPFYTEAWYTLFKQEPQDLMGATKMVDEVKGGPAGRHGHQKTLENAQIRSLCRPWRQERQGNACQPRQGIRQCALLRNSGKCLETGI